MIARLGIILFLFIGVLSCRDNSKGKSKVFFPSTGNYNPDGLEDGEWKYYDNNGNILEEGVFKDGIRVGKWKYYTPNKDSIIWRLYKNPSGSIETNIPNDLFLAEDGDSISVFKSRDSTELFNLSIGKGYPGDIPEYKVSLYKDFSDLHAEIKDSVSQYIKTDVGKEYLFNRIVGLDSSKRSFLFFNIIGSDGRNKLVEISLRCDNRLSDRAQKVFFSIVPNLFVESNRFLKEQETVKVFR